MSAQVCRGAEKLGPKSRAFSGHSRPKDGVASLAYGVQRLTVENAFTPNRRSPPRQPICWGSKGCAMNKTAYIGRRYPRVEDPALVRGKGRFVDDLNPPGLLEAAFLRSPVAHGLIRSTNTNAARALPGVHVLLALLEEAARGLEVLRDGRVATAREVLCKYRVRRRR